MQVNSSMTNATNFCGEKVTAEESTQALLLKELRAMNKKLDKLARTPEQDTFESPKASQDNQSNAIEKLVNVFTNSTEKLVNVITKLLENNNDKVKQDKAEQKKDTAEKTENNLPKKNPLPSAWECEQRALGKWKDTDEKEENNLPDKNPLDPGYRQPEDWIYRHFGI